MEYWLWLRTIKGLGPIMEKRLLSRFGCPKSIYDACKDELLTIKGIGEALANSIISCRSLEKAYSILNECEKKNIKLLSYNDPLYPDIAKEFSYAPTLLYYKGIIKENIDGVAIVGSRKCSSYGKEIALSVAKYLAQNNITVISGMAKGIDSYAHISCLKNGGHTIAFLGNGVDICYPIEHRELIEAIAEKGAIISEYPPETKPRAEYFPKRNALISSWSRKILVVEAAEKSGALITANIAIKQGKELYVPPHEINSGSGKGSNKLLLGGANIFLYPSQLLLNNQNLAKSKNQIKTKTTNINKANNNTVKRVELSSIEEKILTSLSEATKTVEEIRMDVQINLSDLIEHISIMELEGKICAVAGGRYRSI